MENNFLPLGSIVILNDSIKKQVIVTRGVIQEKEGKKYFYEYASCDYPEGVTQGTLNYFNNESIFKVVHKGYEDEESKTLMDNVCKYYEKSDLIKAHLGEEK